MMTDIENNPQSPKIDNIPSYDQSEHILNLAEIKNLSMQKK